MQIPFRTLAVLRAFFYFFAAGEYPCASYTHLRRDSIQFCELIPYITS